MTTFDLIGQIINPQRVQGGIPRPRLEAAPAEPLNVLLGRVLGPPPATARRQS